METAELHTSWSMLTLSESHAAMQHMSAATRYLSKLGMDVQRWAHIVYPPPPGGFQWECAQKLLVQISPRGPWPFQALMQPHKFVAACRPADPGTMSLRGRYILDRSAPTWADVALVLDGFGVTAEWLKPASTSPDLLCCLCG